MIDYSKYNGLSKQASKIEDNFVYFCIPGQRYTGLEFIEEAIKNGAKLCVGEGDCDHPLYIKVSDVNYEFVNAAQIIYQFEDVNMSFIGITGTDGKTSTTTIVNQILDRLSASAYLGTSGLTVRNKSYEYNGMTTPFADELYKYIKCADDDGCEYFVMEASSHALVQKRTEGILYNIVGFTNLSPEHLDFHHNIEEYFLAKAELFNKVGKNGIRVINLDDEYGKRLKEMYPTAITFGSSNESDYKIENIVEYVDHTEFCFKVGNKKYEIYSPLLAKFNVYNLLMAIIIVEKCGYEIETILPLINDVFVSGRMEVLKLENFSTCILDFAHTPDSIEKILKFFNQYKKGKMWVINGCAGGRDSSKRSKIGEIMNTLADNVIISEDDPRNESVVAIADQMIGTISDLSKIVIIPQRIKAIEYALSNSKIDDIIILLGKSGQTKMYYSNYTSEYIESDVVKNVAWRLEHARD